MKKIQLFFEVILITMTIRHFDFCRAVIAKGSDSPRSPRQRLDISRQGSQRTEQVRAGCFMMEVADLLPVRASSGDRAAVLKQILDSAKKK